MEKKVLLSLSSVSFVPKRIERGGREGESKEERKTLHEDDGGRQTHRLDLERKSTFNENPTHFPAFFLFVPKISQI